jgi:uncharacterized membrane protein YfcA
VWNPTLLVEGHPVSILGIAMLGIGVGYVAGMFGIGGGFLLTPLLVAVFGVPLPIAVGTGLCQMVGTSLVSFMRHRNASQGEVRFDLMMLPGALLGVELGARTLSFLGRAGRAHFASVSVPWVNLVVETAYAAMLTFIAVNYWRHGKKTQTDYLQQLRPGFLANVKLGPSVHLPAVGLNVSPFIVTYIGLALGFLSGLLGIGGGVALNPILIYGYGFPIRQSVGTGIVLLFATAVTGTFTHAMRGHVHLLLAMVMLTGASITAQLGANASRKMSGAMLGRVHAVVIVGAIAAVVWDLVSKAA